MNRKSAVSSSALTLACVTAVSIVGYTLLSARKKDSSTKSTPSSRDASDTNDPQEKPTTNHTIEKVNASIPGQIDISQPSSNSALSRLQASNTITIAYASTTGTCKNFAIALHDALKILLKAQDTKVQMCTTDELDWWDELLNNEEDEDASNVPTAGNGTTAAPVVIFILRKFCLWVRLKNFSSPFFGTILYCIPASAVSVAGNPISFHGFSITNINISPLQQHGPAEHSPNNTHRSSQVSMKYATTGA